MAGKITWVWKACPACGTVLHRDEFKQVKGSNGKLYPREVCVNCWPTHNAAQQRKFRADNPDYYSGAKGRQYRKDNPEMFERIEFKKRCKVLGLSFEVMWPLWQSHDKHCDICGELESGSKVRRLSMDHDHITGEFRGFLCNNCNRGLGLIGDTIESVERVLEYLKHGKGVV